MADRSFLGGADTNRFKIHRNKVIKFLKVQRLGMPQAC